MPRPDAVADASSAGRWLRSVVLGTAATAATAAAVGGSVGLFVALGALAATLSGDLLARVRGRSRQLRDELLARLAKVGVLQADERIDARSHDPLGLVRRMLDDYEPASPSVAAGIARLEATLAEVDARLEQTRSSRTDWALAGPPDVIGGLAAVSEWGVGLRRYGDPANAPLWLPAGRPRLALLRIGRLLDDIRLLHSAEIEAAVLTFTLWARALLLVLAPTLGGLSFAPAPDLAGSLPRLAPWIVATTWALCTALIAPRIAALAMDGSASGLRSRRALLAVELPLGVALILAWPGWPSVAFAAGWTNWWQRLGRTPAIPGFSWSRLAAWIAVTAGTQSVGLVIASGGILWWHAVVEVLAALIVIAVIGDSYGAMLPVSAGVAARVLIGGARHARRAGTDAQRLIDEIAASMVGAADEMATLADRGPPDLAAEAALRNAVDRMLPVASRPLSRGSHPLGRVVTAALVDGGHEMWMEDPRALANLERAVREGRTSPVVVEPPVYEREGVVSLVLDEEVAGVLYRLLYACIVEARVHGTRHVQTIVRSERDTVEIRIANPPGPVGSRHGRGRGGREIAVLAAGLPGAGELFRGPTDRAFLGGRPVGRLYGVRFSFSVGDTPADAVPKRLGL